MVSLNKELDLTAIELEDREEFACVGHICGADLGLCGGVICGVACVGIGICGVGL